MTYVRRDPDRYELDDAIVVAVSRMVAAQSDVDREVDAGRVPDRPLVEEVVVRADDVAALAHDAADREEADEDSEDDTEPRGDRASSVGDAQ